MWLNPLSRKPAFSVKVVPSIRIHSIGLCGFWDASAWGQPECLNISKPPTDVGCFALHKLWSNGGSVNQHTRENAGRLKLMKVEMHQLLQCISCRRTILLMFLQKMQWTIQNELEIWGWKSMPFDEELCGWVEKETVHVWAWLVGGVICEMVSPSTMVKWSFRDKPFLK